MSKSNCDECGLRARYDRNPTSLLGRLWRWHTHWCPGWNRYMRSLAAEDRIALARKYNLKKYDQQGP
jgi:hypothetical protein